MSDLTPCIKGFGTRAWIVATRPEVSVDSLAGFFLNHGGAVNLVEELQDDATLPYQVYPVWVQIDRSESA